MTDMASSIAIASGKGGVGKTSIAVNLGLTMARQGRRTVLLDADFGMANAHILIGANPKHYIADALQGGATMQDDAVRCALRDEVHFWWQWIARDAKHRQNNTLPGDPHGGRAA